MAATTPDEDAPPKPVEPPLADETLVDNAPPELAVPPLAIPLLDTATPLAAESLLFCDAPPEATEPPALESPPELAAVLVPFVELPPLAVEDEPPFPTIDGPPPAVEQAVEQATMSPSNGESRVFCALYCMI